MKIPTVFRSRAFMIIVLSLACAALAIGWPQWRDDLRAEGYYGYGYFDLPDTGQTKCYGGDANYSEIPCAGTGQDGEYDINPLSYTDNSDGTVTDDNTGLMWQKGENPTTYDWYKASGTYDKYYNPTSRDVCGELTSGGYSDWRLPTKKELMSIVDYSIPYPGPTIKTAYFPNAYAYDYWSSTETHIHWEDMYFAAAWAIEFYNGYVLRDFTDDNYYVRCVRGGQLDFGNFVDNNDGTIMDTSTSLMWQQGEEGGTQTWTDAFNYCENLELPSGSGQTDWRLPNIKELESITDDTRTGPAIDTTFFPNFYGNYYWSSTTYAYNPNQAWSVYFYYGSVEFLYKNGYDLLSVRCVRGFNYYCDDDSDGYIDSSIDGTCTGIGCEPQGCQTTPGDDCDDNNAAINSGAVEICDGIDNNCDGQIDEGVKNPYYRDFDADGYGNPSNSTQSCTAPSGYVANNTDCDDSDAKEHPGQTWYKDADNDLYSSGDIAVQCLRPAGYKTALELTAASGDCNDSNAAIKPGATEICDGIDNNCNGQIDEGIQYNLTTSVSPPGAGIVTPNCLGTCSYACNAQVTLSAIPAAGSQFTSWSGAPDCSDGAVTMNADKTCTANFKQLKFEENDAAISYTGTWNTKSCPSCSGGSLKYSNQTGAKAVFSFNGTGIKWIFTKANNLGKAKVYLDGVYMVLVDLYSASPQYKVILQKTGLSPGAHTATIEVSGQKNILSKGAHIDIDAFEVIP